MEMYFKFMFWLGLGLVGLGLVLKIVLDEFFSDWNAALELRDALRRRVAVWMRSHEGRTEDWLLELEKARTASAASVRMIDQRREQLRELASVEQRTSLPSSADA